MWRDSRPGGDRNGTQDPRLASFVVTAGAKFRLQVPDGQYHVAASTGSR
ncbi:hypothetical protein [Corallococcus sp. EGB]|nr:hypothetical protein [Corallococcus sp. EGB]